MVWLLVIALLAGADEPGLKPVDAGAADVGPLGLSFRRMQRDFRKPVDFAQVFQTESGKFARSAGGGGLTAVFPRSQYTSLGRGLARAEIPADTRFVIGELKEPAPESGPHRPALTASSCVVARGADRTARHQSAAPAGAVPPSSPITAKTQASGGMTSEGGGVLGDDAYRAARVSALLAQAAAAE